MEIVQQTLLNGKVSDDGARALAMNDQSLGHVVKEGLLDKDHRQEQPLQRIVLEGESPIEAADPALDEDVHGVVELVVLRDGADGAQFLEGDVLGNGGVVVVDGIQNREQGLRVLAVDPDPTEEWRSVIVRGVAVRALACERVVLGLRVHHVLEHSGGEGQMAGGDEVSTKLLAV